MTRTSTPIKGQLALFEPPADPIIQSNETPVTEVYESRVGCRLSTNQSQQPGLSGGAETALCVLGSGSSGNASLLRVGEDVVLIDAGLGPRVTATRMAGTGFNPSDIRAVCLTHLDRDHFNPAWIATLVRNKINVFVHARHIEGLYRRDPAWALHRSGLLHEMDDRGFNPVANITARPIRLPHDRQGTVGFVFDTGSARIGYATDLGHVPDALVRAFTGLDLIAIECNYDPTMQHESPRPGHLKRRIMGGWGHLSNEQAFNAIRQMLGLDRNPEPTDASVVLLHRSRQCNRPELVKEIFDQEPHLRDRVTLSEQTVRTAWLPAGVST